MVDLPRPISVPDGPMSIFDFETWLKPFSKAPFYRVISDRYLLILLSLNNIINREYSTRWVLSLDSDQGFLSNFNLNWTMTESNEGFTAIFRFVLRCSIDIITRSLLKTKPVGDTNTNNPSIPASSWNKVRLVSLISQKYFLKDAISDRIDPKSIIWLRLYTLKHKCNHKKYDRKGMNILKKVPWFLCLSHEGKCVDNKQMI